MSLFSNTESVKKQSVSRNSQQNFKYNDSRITVLNYITTVIINILLNAYFSFSKKFTAVVHNL